MIAMRIVWADGTWFNVQFQFKSRHDASEIEACEVGKYK